MELIQATKSYLPKTAVHVLSNGRRFSDDSFLRKYAEIDHPNLIVGIPIYSDVSTIHDYVVQADGAFDETIRGILNLKRCRTSRRGCAGLLHPPARQLGETTSPPRRRPGERPGRFGTSGSERPLAHRQQPPSVDFEAPGRPSFEKEQWIMRKGPAGIGCAQKASPRPDVEERDTKRRLQ